MKPVGSSRGRGISLLNDISGVSYGEAMVIQRYPNPNPHPHPHPNPHPNPDPNPNPNPNPGPNPTPNQVIQRYVAQPLLLDGFK